MKRRDFLFSATTGFIGLSAIAVTNLYSYDIFEKERELNIPPLYEGELENGKRVFNLELKQGEVEFFKGLKTETLGINANYLGPTLKAKKEEIIKVNIKNSIGSDSTLHWHGFELPATMDGGPHQIIKDGSTWSPEFKITNRASMQWYHSHMLHQTGEQVYKGLAGTFIIEDDESQSLNLPNDYGVDDIPIVLQDRNFYKDGSFRYVTSMPEVVMGIQGNYILTNGVIFPTFKAKKKLTRFRILNGSNARFYMLGFSDNRNFTLIGTDGGLLEKPIILNRIRLAPAERADIIVDLSDGKDISLKNYQGSHKKAMGMMGMMMRNMLADNEFDIMKIKSDKAEKVSQTDIPSKLSSHPKIELREDTIKRDFYLSMRMGMGMMGGRNNMFLINRKSMDMNRVDLVAKKDSYEIWRIVNEMGIAHPFHVHNTQFKILSINGNKPPAHLRGYKDTVIIDPNEEVKIAVYFKNYSDNKHPYMFHCHILEHEDGGMMGQFLVT